MKYLLKDRQISLLFFIYIFIISFFVLSNDKLKFSLISKGQTTPICNSDNLLMNINPNPAKFGQEIEFALSGTEGDT